MEFKSPDTFANHYDPMESRSNGTPHKLWQFRSAENNDEIYRRVRNMRLAHFYMLHIEITPTHCWYRRIPGNVPGRSVGRATAAEAAADVSMSNFVGCELPAIYRWRDIARCNSAAFYPALLRRAKGKFLGHLSHGIIGKRASPQEWPLAHNAETVHTNVGLCDRGSTKRHREKEKSEGE